IASRRSSPSPNAILSTAERSRASAAPVTKKRAAVAMTAAARLPPENTFQGFLSAISAGSSFFLSLPGMYGLHGWALIGPLVFHLAYADHFLMKASFAGALIDMK